jgi:hypothetical protein
MLVASLGPRRLMEDEGHFRIELHYECRPVGTSTYRCGFYTELRNGAKKRAIIELGPERHFAEAQNTIALAANGFYDMLLDSVYASFGVVSVREAFRGVFMPIRSCKWQLHVPNEELAQLEAGNKAGELLLAASWNRE